MRISDWSSDVCSSDLRLPILVIEADIAHEQRRLPAVAVDIDAAHRPRPAAPAIVADQPVAQRLLRIFLELRLKRGAHPQAAGLDAARALLGLVAAKREQSPPTPPIKIPNPAAQHSAPHPAQPRPRSLRFSPSRNACCAYSWSCGSSEGRTHRPPA